MAEMAGVGKFCLLDCGKCLHRPGNSSLPLGSPNYIEVGGGLFFFFLQEASFGRLNVQRCGTDPGFFSSAVFVEQLQRAVSAGEGEVWGARGTGVRCTKQALFLLGGLEAVKLLS